MYAPEAQSIARPPIGMQQESMEDRDHVSAHGIARPSQTELGGSHPRAGARPRHGWWGMAGSLLLLALLLPAPVFAIVGALSCVGQDACKQNTGAVGNLSCNGRPPALTTRASWGISPATGRPPATRTGVMWSITPATGKPPATRTGATWAITLAVGLKPALTTRAPCSIMPARGTPPANITRARVLGSTPASGSTPACVTPAPSVPIHVGRPMPVRAIPAPSAPIRVTRPMPVRVIPAPSAPTNVTRLMHVHSPRYDCLDRRLSSYRHRAEARGGVVGRETKWGTPLAWRSLPGSDNGHYGHCLALDFTGIFCLYRRGAKQ